MALITPCLYLHCFKNFFDIPDHVRDDVILRCGCRAGGCIRHVGIRYDFRTAGAVADGSQNMEPELENVFALLFGAVNIQYSRRNRCGDNLGLVVSGQGNGLLDREITGNSFPGECVDNRILDIGFDIGDKSVGKAISFLGHNSVIQ